MVGIPGLTPEQQQALRNVGNMGRNTGGNFATNLVQGVGLQAANALAMGANGLPVVTDPDRAYADLTRQEYLDYIQNYRGFEEQLLEKAQNDTSLIDQAREDIDTASKLTAGIAQRNVQRYGASLTPAQMQQQELRLQRANTLGGVQSINDARIAQREANTALLSDLINIGQGVNRASQQQLGQSAANSAQLKNAYQQAKANSKAQTFSTIGALGSMAIIALAF